MGNIGENNYDEGIVAFIDILGFSEYLKSNTDPAKVKSVFDFIEKLKYVYSDSEFDAVKIAFFSDSFILATNNVNSHGTLDIIQTCAFINSTIYKKLGLLTRGCIGYGKYYNKNNIAFGPGIVDSYSKEKEAKYARIIISDSLLEIIEKDNLYMYHDKDIDGKYYCNLLLYELMFDCANIEPELVVEKVKLGLKEKRKEIDLLIKTYLNTPYIEKYLWLTTPFNRMCKIMEYKYRKNREIRYEEFAIKAEDYH